uniref:ATP synthase subunit a n=1 Tax=Physalia physalis TaxID=168775 RepID=A0A0S4M622_9CNID|nr:ATP synthase F0 subunit 6 [Physalia sp.]
MTSYFDHFIVVQLVNPYITDCFIIIMSVIGLYYIICYRTLIIPGRLQSTIEIIVDHWVSVIKENLDSKSDFYILPITTLFIFILGINLMGFFLYTFPSTTHISITFGMAVSIWLGVMMFGFFNHKTSFLSMFMPGGAPLSFSPLLVVIELASNISRPIALGMRLAANLTAGHILLAILADFGCKLLFYSSSITGIFPVLIIIFMTGLEVGVLVIQAYVFCLLSMIYLKDSLTLH